MKLLALGTYPVRQPVHGGQRRTHHLGRYYVREGIEYRHACVYDSRIYGPEAVHPDDIPFGSMGGLYAEAPFIDDMASGVFAAVRPAPYAHFIRLIEHYRPDVVQLEQPFMWPLVKRLKGDGFLEGVSLVYSSHNVEAPLKRDLLEGAGVDRRLVARVSEAVETTETEIVASADLVISVSTTENAWYRGLRPDLQTLVIRNGADRSAKGVRPEYGTELLSDEYMLFVGSAYPPNIDGFKRYVLGGGLYGFPPQKRFAICGGVSDGIYQSDRYAPHQESYQDRVQFFGRPNDEELAWLRDHAKAFLLPIDSGGGSNLKTAEALASGKWVIATSTALRSFEDFIGQRGVLLADSPEAFQQAMLDVVYGKPLRLTKRERSLRDGVFWDHLLDDSGLASLLKEIRSTEAGYRKTA